MSGGAFNYSDSTLFDLRDTVAIEIGFYEYGCADESYKPQDPRILRYLHIWNLYVKIFVDLEI